MPAAAESSPTPAARDQLTPVSPLLLQECPGLLACLATVPDPRDPRGRLHPLVGVLALCAAAVLTGATSLLAISE
ncbi:transposase family protein [Streptomyces sp. NBC_01217]|uniref:transposase family protein n=1 Tax=Streptomyces sp. NBC_01217 TaxID=2903779 RepID=UPI002E12701F|nr:transposase family protein [Streptomyces sp. NBC_01217]